VAVAAIVSADAQQAERAKQRRLRDRTAAQVRGDRIAELGCRALPLQAVQLASQHTLVLIGGRHFCSSCLRWRPTGAAQARAWLSACAPLPALTRVYRDSSLAGARRVPADALPVVIKGKEVHGTHELALFRGLYFCRKCGMYSASRVAKLASECLPPNRFAAGILLRIQRGLLPSGMKAWPDQIVAFGGMAMAL